jgi:hypothetical protein
MDRRTFIQVLTLGAMAAPFTSEAQQTGRTHRIGVLTLVSGPQYEDIFRQSLNDYGYVEGPQSHDRVASS